MKKEQINIGLVGVGLNTYWAQFGGLYERLCGYQRQIADKVAREDVRIVNAGIVDSPEKAAATASGLQGENISALWIYISTYALSSTILPIVQKLKAPVIVLNIQPSARIDYQYVNGLGDRGKMTGEWLAYCQACAVPEFANVFNRSGIRYEWVDATVAAERMRRNRMGILGHYYCGMLDIYTDLTKQSATFGTHIEILEMCELKALRDGVLPNRKLMRKLRSSAPCLMSCPNASRKSWNALHAHQLLWIN